MKNRLKKYKDFIIESLSSEKLPSRVLPSTDREDYLRLRSQFCEDVHDLGDFYSKYFSNLCSNSEADPDIDYLEMKKMISRKGWGIESIRNLFSTQADELCKYNFFDFISGTPTVELKKEVENRIFKMQYYEPIFGSKSLDSVSGYIDIFMYKLVEELGLKGGTVWLGGEGWSSGLDSNPDENEYLIKCAYGYHQTKYGKLFLKQVGITEDDLISKALSDFTDWFKSNWSPVISKNLSPSDSYKVRTIINSLNFDEFCVVESDRIVVFAKTISEELEKNDIEISSDIILSNILDYLGLFKLDMEVINNSDVIIWVKSNKFH